MKKTGRRILSVLMSVLMMFCTMPLTVFAANNVEYLERSWDGEKVVTETKVCENPTPIQSIGDSFGGGNESDGGTVIIYGGKVEASNYTDAVAIGGGEEVTVPEFPEFD